MLINCLYIFFVPLSIDKLYNFSMTLPRFSTMTTTSKPGEKFSWRYVCHNIVNQPARFSPLDNVQFIKTISLASSVEDGCSMLAHFTNNAVKQCLFWSKHNVFDVLPVHWPDNCPLSLFKPLSIFMFWMAVRLFSQSVMLQVLCLKSLCLFCSYLCIYVSK